MLLTVPQAASRNDYIVYNDALEDAVSDLRAIIKAEKLKFSRNTNSIERVLEDAETVR